MTHALTDFLRSRMDELGLRNRDIESASGLSRQLVSKYVADDRDSLTRLPDRATLRGFARALGVSPEFLLSKAVQALGLGYSSGDFVNTIASASNDELVTVVTRRLRDAERHARLLEVLGGVLQEWQWEYAARMTGEANGLVPDYHDLEDVADFAAAADDEAFRVLRMKRGVDPETGQPVERDQAHLQAARNVGRLSKGQQRRANAERAGEPEANDPNDMEAR